MIQPNDMGDATSGPGLSAPEGASIPIAGGAAKAEVAGWVCKQCGIDRCKSACPLGYSAALTGKCPMVGISGENS